MSNNKQTDHLDRLPNSFEEVNRVCCFNHTMQLSAKALMKPFDSPSAGVDLDGDGHSDADDILSVEGGDEERDGDDASSASGDDQDEEDEEGHDDDPFEALDADAQQKLLEDIAAVRMMLNKVCGCLRI